MSEGFERESRGLRERLAPIVERVLERHGRQVARIAEPRAARGVWFALRDDHGTPLVLVSAHADSVSFLLGRHGFLHVRDTASTTHAALTAWFEEVLDGALAGGLEVHGDGSATLRTRSGPIVLTG